MADNRKNSDFRRQGKKLSSSLSMDQKLQLLSGANFWQTHALPRQNMSAIRVSDGPHGLRKEAGQATGLAMAPSEPAVCYPTASALACSFDRELMYKIGKALAEEAQEKDVQVLLGPGVNHKRSPLCGRNFEYFSEDPVVSSEMAIPLVKGLQDHGVGACIKHFAANSQEYGRMVSDSIVDRRALMELYLLQFMRIIRRSQPWAVMTSYNLLNGQRSSSNWDAIEGILKKEWKYQGLVMTDWSAYSTLDQELLAGSNVKMPNAITGSNDDFDFDKAIAEGLLTREHLLYSAKKVLELMNHLE
jgi:beta-glucosidase